MAAVRQTVPVSEKSAVIIVNRHINIQNKFHFVKSLNLTNCYISADCPALSKYDPLCPKMRLNF